MSGSPPLSGYAQTGAAVVNVTCAGLIGVLPTVTESAKPLFVAFGISVAATIAQIWADNSQRKEVSRARSAAADALKSIMAIRLEQVVAEFRREDPELGEEYGDIAPSCVFRVQGEKGANVRIAVRSFPLSSWPAEAKELGRVPRLLRKRIRCKMFASGSGALYGGMAFQELTGLTIDYCFLVDAETSLDEARLMGDDFAAKLRADHMFGNLVLEFSRQVGSA